MLPAWWKWIKAIKYAYKARKRWIVLYLLRRMYILCYLPGHACTTYIVTIQAIEVEEYKLVDSMMIFMDPNPEDMCRKYTKFIKAYNESNSSNVVSSFEEFEKGNYVPRLNAMCHICKTNSIKLLKEIIKKNKDLLRNLKTTRQLFNTGKIDAIQFVLEKTPRYDDLLTYGLEVACLNNRVDIAEFILSKGKSLYMSDAFINSCKSGSVYLVRMFLEKYKDAVDNCDREKGLISACKRGHLGVVELIVNERQLESDTLYEAMCHALQNGHLHVVEFLVRGLPIIIYDAHIMSLIEEAYETGRFDRIKRILMADEIVNMPNIEMTDLWSKIFVACCHTGHLDIVELMIKKFESSHLLTELFMQACYYGITPIVRSIIVDKEEMAHGALVSIRKGNAYTIMHFIKSNVMSKNTLNLCMRVAGESDNLVLLKYLIQEGANNLHETQLIAYRNHSIETLNYLKRYKNLPRLDDTLVNHIKKIKINKSSREIRKLLKS
jgi:ankyrin repeat protein